MTIPEFVAKKAKGEKISMVTCYDSTFAKIIEQTSIDSVLVGDSANMTMHGKSTTLDISVGLMAAHIKAVASGIRKKVLIGDMPFMSYRKGLTANMTAVETLMKSGAHALKLEGAEGNLKLVHHVVQSGVPVMGHLGLTPQSVYTLGGFKVQGREKKAQDKILEDALALQDAGCFSIVLECVPSLLAKKITESLEVPVIGIGAGPDVDGQVLVLHDMLGLSEGFKPTFLRHYLNGAELVKNAINHYHQDVIEQKFPTQKESYS
jgi:3-methyl-2-oxobutanoate hydroxymethyltransferase